MDMIEKLRKWLATWSEWNRVTRTRTDGLGNKGCEVSIRPCGVSELQRKVTIVGGCAVRVRYSFWLDAQFYKSSGDEQGAEENAAWLLNLQQWINAESAKGKAPRFGTGEEKEVIRAENGAIQTVSREGLAIYRMALTIECDEKYEEE